MGKRSLLARFRVEIGLPALTGGGETSNDNVAVNFILEDLRIIESDFAFFQYSKLQRIPADKT